MILEIHTHTGFFDEFTHVSESNARADELSVSICAVLLAEACNIGLEPLIKHQIPALTRHRLTWVRKNYIRAETLVRANARLVNHQATIPLAKKWGGGDVASADGMRFVTPVRTINAGPNKKYLVPARELPGTTLFPISIQDFMVSSYQEHSGIPSLFWKDCWNSRPD